MLLCAVTATAQQPFFREFPINIRNNNVALEHIHEAADGTLWFTAANGVYRYDGSTSEFIDFITPELGKPNVVYTNHSEILVGTNTGVIAILSKNDRKIIQHLKLTESEITSFISTNDSLLIGTSGDGILLWHQGKFLKRIGNENGLNDLSIHDLFFYKNQFFATTDGGLICIDRKYNITKTLDIASGLSDNLIYSAALVNSMLYLGMQNGTVSRVDLSNLAIQRSIHFDDKRNGAISKIVAHDYDVFVFDESGKLFTCNSTLDYVFQYQSKDALFTSDHPLGDALIDAEGNIIITNYTNTPLLADTKFGTISEHENISFRNASALFIDRSDRLWIATPSGLFRHNNQFGEKQQLTQYTGAVTTPEMSIISIEQLNDDFIWFGMYGGGLGLIDLKNNSTKNFNRIEGLDDTNILSMTSAPDGMWLATLNGVVKATYSAGKIEIQENDVLNSYSKFIFCVYLDNKGRLWCGSDGNGAAYFKNGELFKISHSKSIVDITEDSEGNIWLLNNKNEIEIFDATGKLHPAKGITISGNKLKILALEKTNQHSIIALTSDGVTELNLSDFLKNHLPSFSEINTNFLNIISKDKAGNIWMALENALVKYSPQKLFKRNSPQIHFERMLVNLSPSDTSIHSFDYNQNHFSFQFSGLWFKRQESLSYTYYLEGLSNTIDSNWVSTRDNVITFPNLPAGKYTLHIRAIAAGSSHSGEFKYVFEIHKPWWQQWYSILLMLIVVMIGFYIVSVQIAKKRERNALLEKQRLQVQLDTLINQINPHFLFNSFNTLIATIHTDTESAVEYVEHLSDYYRKVLQRQNQELIEMRDELDLVEDYLFLQKKRFGNNLIIDIRIEPWVLQKLIPPMTLQLLAENAVKHNIISKQNPLIVSIFNTKDKLVVSNTVLQRPEHAPGLGIGLKNIQYRYKLLFKEQVEIVAEKEQFSVYLPLNAKV